MKIFQILLYVVFFSPVVFGQEISKIDIRIRDRSVNEPIAFVNVGFVDKAIGSVSDERGNVNLTFNTDRIAMSDIIQFSIIGYRTKQYSLKELIDILKKNNIIYLDRQFYDLTEVNISSKWGKKESYGSLETDPGVLGSWKDSQALGGEIATHIKLPNGKQKLTDVTCKLVGNASDSIKVRINVYDYKSRLPDKNLLNLSIFETISAQTGDYKIDLSPYDIIVNNDVVVSVELIKVYGGKVGFVLAGKNGGCSSFLRYVSQDKWIVIKGRCISLSVNTRPLLDAVNDKKRESTFDNLTVYWDASWSSKDRDLDKEIEFLKVLLKKAQVKNLTINSFSHDLLSSYTFNKDDNFDSLEKTIRDLKVLGATGFKDLKFDKPKTDAYLLFSDGVVTLGDDLDVYSNAPLFTISSTQKNSNHELLRDLSDQNDGRHIQLNQYKIQEAVKRVRASSSDVFINAGSEETPYFELKGQVVHANKGLYKCYVSVKDSFNSVATDSLGNFKIKVKKGDVLTFEYPEMLPKEMTIINSTSLTIDLETEFEILDEVIITDKAKQLTADEERIQRGRSKAGTKYYLDYTEFPKSAAFLADLIRGRFPRVRVEGAGANATYSVRVFNSFGGGRQTPPLFVLDGNPIELPPNFLSVESIESISLLLGLAGSVSYGTRGNNGVIVITTKGFSKNKESALAKDNDFTEPIITFNYDQDLNTIAQEFDGTSLSEAYAIFCDAITLNPADITIYLAYFDHVNNASQSEPLRVLTTVAEVASNNVSVLRALAYYLERENAPELARDVYKKIVQIAPNEFQSYIDTARIALKTSHYKEAFEIYKKLLVDEYELFSLDEASKRIVYRELKYILTKYRDKVNYKEVPESYLEALQFLDVRYVFTWNNPQLEFEVQIVNPDKKFYTYNHSLSSPENKFKNDIKNGVMTKEIVIDDDKNLGTWLLNIKSLQQKEMTTAGFIKIETFVDYGQSNEAYNVEIIPVDKLDRKYTIRRHTF